MSRYVLIESRDPFESRDGEGFLEMAGRIAGAGDQVMLFLLQNGVLPLRKGSLFNGKIRELVKNKVEVRADEFSLQERAIRQKDLLEGIATSGMEELVEALLEPGAKALWH